MKRTKRSITLAVSALAVLAIASSAFAATQYKSTAEIAAALTGKTVEAVTAERQSTNKTYGTIAKDAGKLDEFKTENLELKKAQLQARVEAGSLTQDKADATVAAITKNQATCDGDGDGDKIMQKSGLGMGQGNGARNGQGKGAGKGAGTGAGCGGCGQGAGNGAGCGFGAGCVVPAE